MENMRLNFHVTLITRLCKNNSSNYDQNHKLWSNRLLFMCKSGVIMRQHRPQEKSRQIKSTPST